MSKIADENNPTLQMIEVDKPSDQNTINLKINGVERSDV